MAADECNIKVVCRVRPLNANEEKAGSKFILKFPTDDAISISVSLVIMLSSCLIEHDSDHWPGRAE